MILVVSCVIAADTYLAMPKDAKGQDKILQIWLQARQFLPLCAQYSSSHLKKGATQSQRIYVWITRFNAHK